MEVAGSEDAYSQSIVEDGMKAKNSFSKAVEMKCQKTPNLELIKEESSKRNRCQVIAVLCIVNLVANSAYSSIAPFYPYEAVLKGVPV